MPRIERINGYYLLEQAAKFTDLSDSSDEVQEVVLSGEKKYILRPGGIIAVYPIGFRARTIVFGQDDIEQTRRYISVLDLEVPESIVDSDTQRAPELTDENMSRTRLNGMPYAVLYSGTNIRNDDINMLYWLNGVSPRQALVDIKAAIRAKFNTPDA